MSVSQAEWLQPWRHRDSREKPDGGNEGEGRIRIMPPRGGDKLVGGRLPQPRSDPNAAPHQGEFGAGFGHPSPGVRDGPQGSKLELRVEPKRWLGESISRSNFGPVFRLQNATGNLDLLIGF